MKKISLEQINKAVQSFVDIASDAVLLERIGKTAITLIDADDGEFFLYKKNLLKRVYSSQKNGVLNKKDASKLFATDTILSITQKTMRRWQLTQMPEGVKWIMVVPLLSKKKMKSSGFIFLYFESDEHLLTKDEQELLTLYSRIASLALTKAELQEESQKALEIRDRFISLASHELRTPLTSIHGYIQLLHNRVKGQQTLESRWINELLIESIRMTQLVKGLLDINRIKQGQFAFVFSEVLFQEIVTRTLDKYKLTDANHTFELQSSLSNPQIKVVGDADKLGEMVSGLLGNAVKFSKTDEKITVIIKDSKNFVTLIVKDRGRGISKNDLNAIFEGFYKPDQTSHIEGMGLGLLLARHIVENHRGKLRIQSKENRGTTVTITLPII
jgi:signal transduction histidine kinase